MKSRAIISAGRFQPLSSLLFRENRTARDCRGQINYSLPTDKRAGKCADYVIKQVVKFEIDAVPPDFVEFV